MLIVATFLTCSSLAQETQRQYLSGLGKDDAVPWKFMCTSGANSGYWTTLPVPSQWDMHGFGTLNYSKDPTNSRSECGLYEHTFAVPASWSTQRVFLVFEGSMTDTSARLNGESVGPLHQGSFYQFKYEVTKFVKFGDTNQLEVTVAKHSANRSVNDAERTSDYWIFGGIFRPVYLEAVPQQFIQRVAIDARADGNIAIDVFANGITNADLIEAQIISRDGKNVGNPFSGKPDQEKVSLKTHVAGPLTWNAETPNLYAVDVRLKRGSEVLHRVRQKFGFRTVEVREGDGVYVNGQRVVLKGANRHSFWPASGRCLSEAVHRMDIDTLKDMNMNAVRMSHYPPDPEFLELCDEAGLYVLDELGGWQKHYDSEVGAKLVEEMVTRDVNHPSILFWDNGNEGGWNTNLDNDFSKFDPQQRKVLHPWRPFSGINTAHYLTYSAMERACRGMAVDTNDTTKYIYMPTEFLHGLFDGGAGAGLEDYWKVMNTSKYLAGGFIWALVDEGVKRPDTGEIDVFGNRAPDGLVGPYRQREGSFYTVKEIWSPIQITRQSNGSFTVENHYSFTDAKQCRFAWERRRFHTPAEDKEGFEVVDKGIAEVPAIPPGGKGSFSLPLPKASERTDALALRVDDPSGRELWTWVFPTARAGDLTAFIHTPAPQRTSAVETNDLIEVKSGELLVKISKQTGRLNEVSRGTEKFSLANGPRLTVGDGTLTSIRAEQDGPDYVVVAKFSGDLKSLTWRVNGNGWVQCDYKYSASGPRESFGVMFDYPEDCVKGKRWLGDGPFRVWKNRLRGVTFGLWENSYNDTITGYRDWDYPEFKGCFANVRWLQLDTTEGQITIVPEKVPYVQVLTPTEPPADLVARTKVNLPQAGLAFLHGIPAQGSKFHDAKSTGPQGQLNVAEGDYSGSVSFYFGELKP
jgi:Glycosyl hydrolases family 2, TIM barrel domain/Glycosyl hydrolases family 2, sugar binding domain/Glycosyl hydrolases family 2/Beta galactosidase small chain